MKTEGTGSVESGCLGYNMPQRCVCSGVACVRAACGVWVRGKTDREASLDLLPTA